MPTTNIGQISSFFKGTSAPTNTDLVWLDTSVTPQVFKVYDTVALSWKRVSYNLEKSITVASPSSSEDVSIFFTNQAITISEIRAVLIGSSTPSVTWTIRFDSDRSATGTEVVTGGTTTTSTTTGSDVTTFNDATIPADNFIWLETTAQSGTVGELNVTIVYTVD